MPVFVVFFAWAGVSERSDVGAERFPRLQGGQYCANGSSRAHKLTWREGRSDEHGHARPVGPGRP